MRRNSESNAEVDFVLAQGRDVLGIEVKSGSSGTLRSLHQFMLKHPGKSAVRFDLNPPGVQQIETVVQTASGARAANYRLVNLPLYLASHEVLERLQMQDVA
jgi:uncharacterized protein